jgi:hypothetical protein
MVDFSKLKSSRGSTLSKLTEKLESMNKGSSNQKDERIYKPGFDKKEGKGYAVVRFLPNKDGETFVRVFHHAFNASGGWYIENSRSTIDGEKDPVGISNGLYWAKGESEGNESLKNLARKRKRNTKYFANVFVVKDTINPENNGKVMIYEFGAQIFKMIEAAAKPEFEDDEPLDAFDMWSGADFKIKIVGKEIPDQRTGGKVVVPNYENSEFDRPSELFAGDDDKKEELFKQTHSLEEFIKVKSFEELATRFKKVTGEEYNALESGDPAEKVADKLEQRVAQAAESDTPEPARAAVREDDNGSGDDDDDVLAMFRKLAED